MLTKNNIGIIVLAGGKSSRMGSDKGLVLVNNKPMIEHIIETAKKINNNIIIISNQKNYHQFGFPVYEDLIKDKGPIGGIYTGLKNSAFDFNLILSCDTPFIEQELLDLIITQTTDNFITVAVYKSKIHPLIGLYHKKYVQKIREHIKQNQLKLMLLLKELNAKQINADHLNPNNFRNINSPKDLQSNNE